jgi:DNA repair protein RadC
MKRRDDTEGADADPHGATDVDRAAREPPPHYLGHRQRLRDRLAESGPTALADYEMLELVLFLAKPRGDVKPLAKALIQRFGGFSAVLAAPAAELMKVVGVGETTVGVLKTVRAAAQRLARAELLDRPTIASAAALLAYCRVHMAHEPIEQVRLIFLDRRNVVIADEKQQQGTVDHTPVYPREVVKRALELGASAVIMVHNHPSGDPTPSRADIEMTREVARALDALGIRLHDHLIIGRAGEHSFKANGRL